MSLPLILHTASLATILDELAYTIGALSSTPIALPFRAAFETFLATNWTKTNNARIVLILEVGKTSGVIAGADDALDDFVDLLDRTLLIIVKNDRSAPLYAFFFGAKSASVLKRPVLDQELVTVRAWIPTLQQSPVPALAALAPQLVVLVAAADAAVAAHLAAENALKMFDTITDMKTLIDAFNTLRQNAYGQLAAIPHKQPDLMLPASFADRFVRHESHKGLTSLTNPTAVQARIDTMEKDLTAAKAHREALLAAAQAKEDAKAAEAKAAEAVAHAKADLEAAQAAMKAAEKAAKDAKKQGAAPPPPPAPAVEPPAPAAPPADGKVPVT